MSDPQQHRKRVDRALNRAADRDRADARLPDDVLAVEVRRLSGLLDRQETVIARYRRRHEELLAAEAAAASRADEWRDRALAAERGGSVDLDEVKRLRKAVAHYRANAPRPA